MSRTGKTDRLTYRSVFALIIRSRQRLTQRTKQSSLPMQDNVKERCLPIIFPDIKIKFVGLCRKNNFTIIKVRSRVNAGMQIALHHFRFNIH